MAKGSGSGGRNFASMSNKSLVSFARRKSLTDIGQITKSQRSALNSAVKSGKLFKGTSYRHAIPKTIYYGG